jgi:O-antigen/teichoic acid export membrane protein
MHVEHPSAGRARVRLREFGVLSRSIVRWFRSSGGSLKERTFRGAGWSVVGEACTRLAAVTKVAVLGRLLAPRDFGLLGIALLVQQWVESFTQTGVNAALIQKREDIRPYLNSGWTFQILRSLLVAALIFLAAPLGGRFFQNPDAIPAIRAVGLLTLLWGFTNPAVVYLRKEMDFRRDVAWRLTGAVVGLAVGIPLGFWLRNAWALVLSVVAARAAETIASYWVHPYRPRLQLEWSRVWELMRFGRWIFWLNIVAFFELYIDSLAIGRFLGSAALGHYQVAQQIALQPVIQIANHVQGVLFPAFSKLDRNDALRRAFLSAARLLSAALIPLGCFFTVFAEPLVYVVLGKKWLVISPALRILVWAGVFRALTGVTGPLFLSVGQPKWSAVGLLVKVLLTGALVYPLLTRWGILGVAGALAAASAVSLCYQLAVVHRILRLRLRDLAAVLKPAVVGAAPFLAIPLVVRPSPSLAVYLLATAAIGLYLVTLFSVVQSHFRNRP